MLLALVVAHGAHAERADRLKPLTIQADQGGQLDLQRQVVVFTGNVVVTKGTMVIRAGRIEVRQTPDGYDTAVAFGTPGQPATFRQKRDGVDETMAGQAERIEYDGKADVVKFVNNAAVRRLRGATPADEISGNLITYDSTTDVLSVTGGATRSATNPDGRVRAVLIPREGSDAASAAVPLRLSPALAASAPGGAGSGAGKP
ncbi:MAG: lipopolysaccharide transport periplasmic protein LptA [Burkholderiales bacterium]|nr:lipopolysaccharide transport periplasmic protein LptA [Burkholderiales bacterium]